MKILIVDNLGQIRVCLVFLLMNKSNYVCFARLLGVIENIFIHINRNLLRTVRNRFKIFQ